ncbi:MAG: YggS family pyridoxal phosphate-dependent enzyme [bacterium]|nr:YggS family pyridoxal phosphate-dependent enzyme [bacterium]MDD5354018.1 YggS family pyridoxal phosphate-dependent enzyme [bacterium]MDD5755913.1 YggS family pyridoxal phosphate-dependent enzyme [bacterium]
MSAIYDNVQQVRSIISRQAAATGRNPGEITLVAVTKTVAPELVQEALAAGVTDIGENKVQEALSKSTCLGSGFNWHLIGHLQTNKVKAAVQLFALIHSVDSLKLIEAIDREAGWIGKQQQILIEINISGEESKYGCTPADALDMIRAASLKSNVHVAGLMTMAPFTADKDRIQAVFRGLRELKDTIAGYHLPNIEMKHLSMGMSHDFEIAIAEGATLVRIGTAIFGKR